MDKIWLISIPDDVETGGNGASPACPSAAQVASRLSEEQILSYYSCESPRALAFAGLIAPGSQIGTLSIALADAPDDHLLKPLKRIARKLRGKSAAVVSTSQNVHRLITHLLGLPTEGAGMVASEAGAVNLLLHDRGKWMVECINDGPGCAPAFQSAARPQPR